MTTVNSSYSLVLRCDHRTTLSMGLSLLVAIATAVALGVLAHYEYFTPTVAYIAAPIIGTVFTLVGVAVALIRKDLLKSQQITHTTFEPILKRSVYQPAPLRKLDNKAYDELCARGTYRMQDNYMWFSRNATRLNGKVDFCYCSSSGKEVRFISSEEVQEKARLDLEEGWSLHPSMSIRGILIYNEYSSQIKAEGVDVESLPEYSYIKYTKGATVCFSYKVKDAQQYIEFGSRNDADCFESEYLDLNCALLVPVDS